MCYSVNLWSYRPNTTTLFVRRLGGRTGAIILLEIKTQAEKVFDVYLLHIVDDVLVVV